jgi:hypothetical protein
VLATLTFLTAKTVADAMSRVVKTPLQEVIVSGGGMFNKTLMAQLEWTLWPAVPRPITVYGLHPLAKEPAAFALLAVEALRRRAGEPALGDGGAAAGGAGEDPSVSASQHLVRMTLREKCAQMVHISCAFPDEDPERTSQLVRKGRRGGMILSGGSVFDVPSFVNWAQKVAKFPLLVSADFEQVGRVSGGTVFPSDPAIAVTKSATSRRRRRGTWERRRGRWGSGCCWARRRTTRSRPASIEGVPLLEGVAVCLKRFPDAGVRTLCGKAEAVMVGHEVVPDSTRSRSHRSRERRSRGCCDASSASRGSRWTDALSRLGASVELVVRAANAGADVLLRPADAVKAIDALEAAAKDGRVSPSTIDRAVMRQFLHKERMGLFADRMVDTRGVEKTVGCPTHRAAADRITNVVSQLRR